VVDVALGGGQLVLSVLQSGVGVIKVVSLEVTAVIRTHQLIVQLLNVCLKAGVLLKELSVALLNILDDMVLGFHLADVLLQSEAQVSTHRCDLLKQGAHMLRVACCERPTRKVGWKLRVTNGGHALTPYRIAVISNGEQGDGGVVEDQQVALTKLCEGLVGSPLYSVVEVIASSRGKLNRHRWVSGVSQNVQMDLAVPQPKLMVRTTTICGNPRVIKAVQHIPEQGGKTGVVQPITTEPSVGSEGGVGVVILVSKTRKK
jgi:hypothetical protein